MPTRLTPTCDKCGTQEGDGYDLQSSNVLCLECAIPDQWERER